MADAVTFSGTRFLRTLIGPGVIFALAGVLWILQMRGFFFANSALLFMVVLVVLSLTGEALVNIINVVLALTATLLLYTEVGRVGASGEGLVRLLVPVFAFPIAVAVVVLMRRRLAKALAAPVIAERMLFQAIMASMHDAIVETDWKGIRDVNASFCKMTGFTREELIGAKAPFPFWPVEQYATIASVLETSMRGQALDFEMVLTRKNSERFPVLLSVSRILQTGHTSNRVLYSFREITELKRAQEELGESQRKLRQAIDAARIGAWEWDFRTNRITWSGHHETIWGMRPGEFDGTYEMFASRIHPDDVENVKSIVEEGRRRRIGHATEFRVVWPDGSIHWIAASGAHTFGEKGEAIRMSGVVQDVTERRRAELLLSGEGKILGKIARGISLDSTLASLVQTIEDLLPGGMCSILTLMEDGKRLHVAAAPHLPEAFNEMVEGFEIGPSRGSCGTAAYTGKRVVVVDTQTDPRWGPWKDLAATHGLRACTSEPILARDGRVLGAFAVYLREPRELALEQLHVLETAAQLAAIAIERDREERELRDAKEAAEIANRTKDRFLNLLSHELRTPLTPILTLASVLENDSRLPEDLRADMEMIRRNAEVEARLVDDLLELVGMAHGTLSGDIGSKLWETLASARAQGSDAKFAPPSALPAKKGLRILVVEDHVDTAKTISRMLTRHGHAVTSAGTMAEGLELGLKEPFDLLLSDVGLPDGTGLELVQQLRQVRPMPAIALSGFGSEADVQRSLGAGFLLHLTKPVNFRALHDAIDRFTA